MSWTINEINAMDRDTFVNTLGWIFEHSPWVAEQAFDSVPFASVAELHQTMVDIVKSASTEAHLTLLRAHPDLAGKLQMTEASVSEQKGAGLSELTPDEYAEFTSWNAAYTSKFGFPFILAVRGHNKHSILESMRSRIYNEPEAERGEALRQIGIITRFRLLDLAADE